MTGLLQAIVSYWETSGLTNTAGPLWRDLAAEESAMPYSTFTILEGGPWNRTFPVNTVALHEEEPVMMFRVFQVGDAQAQALAESIAKSLNGTKLAINTALNDGFCFCGAEVLSPPISLRRDLNETSDDVWIGIVKVRFPMQQGY